MLKELNGVGGCLTFWNLCNGGKVILWGLGWSSGVYILMLGSGYDIRLVTEAMTDEELVECLRTKCTVASTLCWIGAILWEYVQAYIQVLVDVLDKYPLGERTWLVVWWRLGWLWRLGGGRILCRDIFVRRLCCIIVLLYEGWCGGGYIFVCGILVFRLFVVLLYKSIWYFQSIVLEQVVYYVINFDSKRG